MNRIAAFLILLLPTFLPNAYAEQVKQGEHAIPDELNILFLNTNDPVLPWTQGIVQGMSESIVRSPVKAKLYIENIFTDLIQNEDDHSVLIEDIRQTVRKGSIDVVVVDDGLE